MAHKVETLHSLDQGWIVACMCGWNQSGHLTREAAEYQAKQHKGRMRIRVVKREKRRQ